MADVRWSGARILIWDRGRVAHGGHAHFYLQSNRGTAALLCDVLKRSLLLCSGTLVMFMCLLLSFD